MPETSTIAGRVLAALADSGRVSADELADAQEGCATDAEAGRALLARGVVDQAAIAEVAEDSLGIPSVDLSSYAPDGDALKRMPASVAQEHAVLPLFEIEGMLTVAVGRPADMFELDELGAELGVEVEPVFAEAPAVAEAIDQYYFETTGSADEAGTSQESDLSAEEEVSPQDEVETQPAVESSPGSESPDLETPHVWKVEDGLFGDAVIESGMENLELSTADFFEVDDQMPVVVEAPAALHEELGADVALEPEAAPASDEEPAVESEAAPVVEAVVASAESSAEIDLDVLAVADDGRVAVLVADILERAVARGATRIHLLPYKSDFFLVFRVRGRLEKVASAPLSMQKQLIEGFKSYAKLSAVSADLPALGRLHSEISGKQVVLTVSSVPTVAGQRLVVTIAAARPQPRDFIELGMTEAESRALKAMVERGQGILLVAAPVAGGRSSTYYALLSHAAQVGKTVYSVERSVEHEIPAVAQVLVNPGSPVGAASYFAAGMHQDTDVLAIDSMQSVEDAHLAIEAAGLGKLVIATFAGSDIVTGVRRMLDLGAEPVSLASALTLGIGQRVVRLNCPDCSLEEKNPVSDRIPGGEKGMTTRRGAGCPACGGTGFAGATGIFEILPFTEPVRAQIAQNASAEKLAHAARAAGMRPMIASGLVKVREGLVSADELDRVLRFGA